MNAVTLNRVLGGVIAFLLIGTIAGFYFASRFLEDTALQTDHMRTDISLTQENVVKLQQLQTILANNKDSVDRARNFVSTLQDFSYQDRVVEDLSAYAALAGPDVKITNFTFTDPNKKPTTSSSTKKKKPVTIPGVRVLDATATLNSPVSYNNFMRFLRAIEQNLTKIQVTGITIAPDVDDPNLITGTTINLQVYVRDK